MTLSTACCSLRLFSHAPVPLIRRPINPNIPAGCILNLECPHTHLPHYEHSIACQRFLLLHCETQNTTCFVIDSRPLPFLSSVEEGVAAAA